MVYAKLAALSGAIGVLAGAFGAHALASRVDAKALQTWKTGAEYNLLHSTVLLCVATTTPQKKVSCVLFSSGIVLFSGSLYLLVLSGQKWLGAITPIGGLALTAGWIALAL